MTTVLRRLILLLVLMFWQGGFMFYGAVVVPVGAEVLGSHQIQGFVTRSVTNHLNAAGAVALVVWGWDIAAEPDRDTGRQRWRWRLLVGLAMLLGGLVWLHAMLDNLLDVHSFRVLDLPRYRMVHQAYLIVSTVQWAVAVVLLGLTLRAWRERDGQMPLNRR